MCDKQSGYQQIQNPLSPNQVTKRLLELRDDTLALNHLVDYASIQDEELTRELSIMYTSLSRAIERLGKL